MLGAGLINSTINKLPKLPFELHLPGYSYCGPGTKLRARLARGDQSINKLDSYCKNHDIEYSKFNDLERRHQADKVLQERAWEQVKSGEASFGEKSSAWIVTNIMKAKRKLGMGASANKKKKNKSIKGKLPKRNRKRYNKLKSFNVGIINSIKRSMKNIKGSSLKDNIKHAVTIARKSLSNAGEKKN